MAASLDTSWLSLNSERSYLYAPYLKNSGSRLSGSESKLRRSITFTSNNLLIKRATCFSGRSPFISAIS